MLLVVILFALWAISHGWISPLSHVDVDLFAGGPCFPWVDRTYCNGKFFCFAFPFESLDTTTCKHTDSFFSLPIGAMANPMRPIPPGAQKDDHVACSPCIEDDAQSWHVFLKGAGATKHLLVAASTTISEIRHAIGAHEARMFSFNGLLRDEQSLASAFHGSHCHIHVERKGRGGAKRAPWETYADKLGVQLAVPSQIQSPISYGGGAVLEFPVSELTVRSTGIAFASYHTLNSLGQFQTVGPCALITKGWISNKVVALGYEPGACTECSLSIWDPAMQSQEPIALTIINLSSDEDDYFSPQEPEAQIDLKHVPRIPVLVEARKCDSSAEEWNTYKNAQAFDKYVINMIGSGPIADNVVVYKTYVKDDYICKRLQIPTESRNSFYERSGEKSIQVKPLRRTDDPQEESIEVIRIEVDGTLSQAYAKLSGTPGFLGLFKTQRAFYIRITDEKLSEARVQLFPGDERYTDFNLKTKGSIQLRIAGFPSGTTLKQCATAMYELNITVVPIKCLNHRELATFICLAPSVPEKLQFHTSIGIIQIEKMEKQVKPKDPKGPQAPPRSAPKTSSGPKTSQVVQLTSMRATPPNQVKHANILAATAPHTAAPSVSLSSKVASLENTVVSMQQEIQGIKADQGSLRSSLQTLESKQDQGFKALMDAVSNLNSRSTASASAQSPPHKLPKIT